MDDWTQAFEGSRTADVVRHVVAPANEQILDRLDRCLKAIRERT